MLVFSDCAVLWLELVMMVTSVETEEERELSCELRTECCYSWATEATNIRI